ncbi:hypothetical protein ABTD83_21265, partial [Acinetobacter baumannii]
ISNGSKQLGLWNVAEARSSADGSSLTIVIDGAAEENGRVLIARKTLTLDGSRLRITTQTRAVGEPFIMRNSHDLRQKEGS